MIVFGDNDFPGFFFFFFLNIGLYAVFSFSLAPPASSEPEAAAPQPEGGALCSGARQSFP